MGVEIVTCFSASPHLSTLCSVGNLVRTSCSWDVFDRHQGATVSSVIGVSGLLLQKEFYQLTDLGHHWRLGSDGILILSYDGLNNQCNPTCTWAIEMDRDSTHLDFGSAKRVE